MLLKSFLKNKSYVFFALCISYSLFSCSEIGDTQPTKKTGTQQAGLKGKVKTLEESHFKAKIKGGKVEKGDLRYKFISTYDNMGSKTDEKAYTSDGRSSSESTYTYDDSGNLLFEWKNYNEEGRLAWRKTYQYDDKGNEIEWKNYDSDGNYSYTYNYDGRGYLIEIKSSDHDGSLRYKYTYTYDDRGNLSEWKYYNSDGSLNWKRTYQYDDKGNEIGLKSYDYDGSLVAKYVHEYKYNSEGNWTERITFVVKGEGGEKEAIEIIERKITYH